MLRKGLAMVSYLIIIVVIVVITIMVVAVINPILERGREIEAYNEGLQVMKAINSEIREVMFEAPGTRRVIDLNIKEGELDIVGSENKIKYTIENVDYFSPGTSREGNIIIRSGAWMDATEKDIDGDGSDELVLENDAVIFAMKKLGTEASPVSVNTTNIIDLIRNVRADVNISNPRTGIYVNDDVDTSAGTGYTKLTREGTNLASSGVLLWLNSTQGTIYEAIFTLGAEADFVEMNVRII